MPVLLRFSSPLCTTVESTLLPCKWTFVEKLSSGAVLRKRRPRKSHPFQGPEGRSLFGFWRTFPHFSQSRRRESVEKGVVFRKNMESGLIPLRSLNSCLASERQKRLCLPPVFNFACLLRGRRLCWTLLTLLFLTRLC